MQCSSVESIPSYQHLDAVHELLRRELQWQNTKPGRCTNQGLAFLSGNGDHDDRRHDVCTYVMFVAQRIELDYEYVEMALEYFDISLSFRDAPLLEERQHHTSCCAIACACLNLAMKRNAIAVSFLDGKHKTINDDLIEFHCHLMDALNISWNQVSRVQDILLSELPAEHCEPVTMTSFVTKLVSLFPSEMQSNLVEGCLAQVKISMGDCSFMAAFPKSTLAVAAVQNTVKQYRKKCDVDLFLNEKIGAALQQMASLTTSMPLLPQASFWLLLDFDESLLLESFPRDDDDSSLMSFHDSLTDRHRCPKIEQSGDD